MAGEEKVGGFDWGVVDPKRLACGWEALLGVEGAPKNEGEGGLGGSDAGGRGGAPKKLGVGVDATGLGCPNPPKVMEGPGAALDGGGAGGGAPHPPNDGVAARAEATFGASGGGAPNPKEGGADGFDGCDEGSPRPRPPLLGFARGVELPPKGFDCSAGGWVGFDPKEKG